MLKRTIIIVSVLCLGMLAIPFLPHTRMHAQIPPVIYDIPCPVGFGISVLAQTIVPSTGHAKAYLCVDANGNVLINAGQIAYVNPTASPVYPGQSVLNGQYSGGFPNSVICSYDNVVGVLRCNNNLQSGGSTNGFHQQRIIETGSCTMAAGTCSFTYQNPFTAQFGCVATWSGTGTLTTGASIKCTSTTTAATVTSSTGTDTAQMSVIANGI